MNAVVIPYEIPDDILYKIPNLIEISYTGYFDRILYEMPKVSHIGCVFLYEMLF